MISSLHAYLKASSKLSIKHLFQFYKMLYDMRRYHPNLLKANLTQDLQKIISGIFRYMTLVIIMRSVRKSLFSNTI